MRILTTELKFPEGPVPLPDGSVAVVEMAGKRVSRVRPDGRVEPIAETGGGPNGLALGPDGALYLCNNGGLGFRRVGDELHSIHGLPDDYVTGSIQRIDLETGAVDTLYTACGDIPLRGPNDLAFDSAGGFYFTDFGKVEGRVRDIGAVFYATPDGNSIREVIHPIANPNGIAISADGRTLYVTETETCRLWAYEILGPGKLRMEGVPSPNGGRLVAGLDGWRRFDGFALEACGNICVATLITGEINVISPGGALVDSVKLPDRQITNIAFGGADMRKAYVTMSWKGGLVELDWPRPGLPLVHQVLPEAA